MSSMSKPKSKASPEKLLREEERMVFQFHWLCFLYLAWPMPIKWNKDYTALVEVKPRCMWIFWRICVWCTFSLGVCSLSIIPYFMFRPRPHVKASNMVFWFTFGVFACYVAVTLWCGPRIMGALLSFVNGLSRLSLEFKKSKYSIKKLILSPSNTKYVCCKIEYKSYMAHGSGGTLDKNVGMFLGCVIVVAAPIPFVGAFMAIQINLDVTYWILDEFFLPPKEYWGWDMIGLEILIRSVYITLACAECVRTGSYCISLLLIVVNRFQNMIHVMITHPLRSEDFIRYYNQLQLYYKMVIDMAELQLYCILMMTFWMAVMSICALVKLHDRLSPSLLLIAGFLATAACLANAIVIPLACKLTFKVAGLLVINQKRVEFRHAKRITLKTKANLKTSRALQQK